MIFDRSTKKKTTFQSFLSAEYARDYILQDSPYEEQITRAAALIRESDCVLLGAGSGMSAAAGAQYGGRFFEENFAEFQKAYGKGPYMRDMYAAGFYPFPDEESRWGYWSHMALLAGVDLDVTPLHRTLLGALAGKDLFLLSTNVDGQFEKAGLPAEKIFATQGSYNRIQCLRGCHPKTYDGVSLFRQMEAARSDARIPAQLVPKCPVCGGPMTMNLRCDDHFVQDEDWYAAESRFSDFLAATRGRKTVLLELGVGYNTPTIIRFPFEKLARQREDVSLIRLSRSKAAVPASLGARAVGISMDMAKSIADLAAALAEKDGSEQ
ncbi:MAG: Sir2 silent information regulator family NAD-dependent deacetylase [Oscillospiraceae bacterium]|nr:Sir2 silent information regulator family NAD-dependent deacetylase [Oscillospiraceae bacterium]